MVALILFFIIVSVSSKQFPREPDRCRLSDPKIGDCLRIAIPLALDVVKIGHKQRGIVSLEPLHIPKLYSGNSSSGSVALRQEYENLNLHNIITDEPFFDMDANLSDDNCYLKFKSITPKIRMEADYKITGQIMDVPINGHGRCNNFLYNATTVFDIKCEKYTEKDKKYMRVTDLKIQFLPKTIVFDFENIIDGNEQLSKEVLKTMNEHSESIYGEIGSAFDGAIGKVYKEFVNQILALVAEKDLISP